MSHDYQADYTGSPITSIPEFIPLGTASPVNTVPYVSYVAAIPPVNNNMLSPLNSNIVYTGMGVVSPLVNTAYSCIGTSSPVHIHIQPFGSASTPYVNQPSFEERTPEFTQSNSSFLNFSGSSNDSINRYSLVGYNSSPTTKPCGRDNKAGWYDIHNKHVLMASRFTTKVILCGDSIIAGLSRYKAVWNKYFRPLNTVNCGIGGDRTQHVLWRMENMTLPETVKYIVVHCGTNNIDRDSAQEIANGVMSCGLVLQEQNPKLNVIITGLLPRDLANSRRRYKIIQTNKYLKQYCRQFSNFSYMKQDSDWVLESGLLNEQLYYDDHLHLVESGNHKFATSITNIINKLSNNEEVNYSSDDEVRVTFERIQSQIRQVTPQDDTPVESSLGATGESRVPKKKRKRCLSSETAVNKPSTSQKRRRTEKYLNRELSNDDSCSHLTDTPKRHSGNRKIKTAKKEQFSHVKELRHNMDEEKLETSEKLTEHVSDEHLEEGTVKSIDISLADRDRREARKAKFGDSAPDVDLRNISDLSKACIRNNKSKTSAPSALVLRIRKSMEQARKELSKKKLAVSLQGYNSHGDSSQGESTPPNTKMTKLISDYGSGSDSE